MFVFGVSALPPRYLEAMKALGEHIDVHYMFTNPCQYYWGDIRDKRYLARAHAAKTAKIFRGTDKHPVSSDDFYDTYHETLESVGNSLLASMGKLGRDNLLLISDLNCVENDQGFVEVDRTNLLTNLQADILELVEPGDIKEVNSSKCKTEIAKDDRSLTLEICHSPMREVEILHDRLLDMFTENPDLKPRDIIVMVADINAYIAAIQAVFGNAPGERYIPFSISDRTADQESPIISTFLRLLSLGDSRCTAADLLEMLEVPAVLRRFDLTQRQFEKLKLWIQESGIRWGLDATTATHFDLPQQHINTWLFGLERMLLGYAMPSNVGLFNGISAYDEVQGLEADIAGKLAQFCRVLMSIQGEFSQTKIGIDWVSLLVRLFDDLFSLDSDEENVGRLMRDQFENWLQQLEDAGFDSPVSIGIVRDYFQNKLGGERVSQRFLAGQVNFCTLMPMRSIPFKVVCLLGMNDGAYPRATPSLGFDLMASRPRAGDRSRRDDDRYLFLEAIQSAQLRLYISYVGRSIKDNSEKVPSVLVTELMDYCTQGYCLEGDNDLASSESAKNLIKNISIENPLVPFSPNAFLSKYSSYAAEWLPAVKGEGQVAHDFIAESGLASDPTFSFDEIELTELQAFWRLPVKYFFNRRLKVFFDQSEDVLDDFEPFELDSLQGYLLKDSMLNHLIKYGDSPDSINTFMQNARASGGLPHHNFGELVLEKNTQEALEQYAMIAPFLEEKRAALEVNLTFMTTKGEVKLLGWLDRGYRDGLIYFRSGKVKGKYWLSAWIDHLCQCAMGQALLTHYFGVKEKITFEPISQDDAKEQLHYFIEHYVHGLDKPLAFFPSSAWAGYEASLNKEGFWQDDEKTQNKAYKAMRDGFSGGYMTIGERKDAYISRLWKSLDDDALAELLTIAKHVFYVKG